MGANRRRLKLFNVNPICVESETENTQIIVFPLGTTMPTVNDTNYNTNRGKSLSILHLLCSLKQYDYLRIVGHERKLESIFNSRYIFCLNGCKKLNQFRIVKG